MGSLISFSPVYILYNIYVISRYIFSKIFSWKALLCNAIYVLCLAHWNITSYFTFLLYDIKLLITWKINLIYITLFFDIYNLSKIYITHTHIFHSMSDSQFVNSNDF